MRKNHVLSAIIGCCECKLLIRLMKEQAVECCMVLVSPSSLPETLRNPQLPKQKAHIFRPKDPPYSPPGT